MDLSNYQGIPKESWDRYFARMRKIKASQPSLYGFVCSNCGTSLYSTHRLMMKDGKEFDVFYSHCISCGFKEIITKEKVKK